MIIGHKKQWQHLKQGLKNNTLSHAYLFYGPPQIGKKKIALELADLIGKDLTNFTLIEPVKGVIHIDQIKGLKLKLSLSNDAHKIVIIDNASAMTRDAQGALLKLLEEPRGKSLLILIAESKNQLLPTIISRCQLLRFSALSKKEIEQYLESQKVKDKSAAWFSFGRPGRAIDYLNKDSKIQKQRLKDIQEMIKAPLYERFDLAERLSKDKPELLASLEIWLSYFREILLKKLNKKKIRYSSKQLKEIIDLIETTKYLVSSTNANARLALEILLMKI